MKAPDELATATGDTSLPERTAAEQVLMIAAGGIGILLAQRLPPLGLVMGAIVFAYGAAILLNYRGMQSRFLKPLGIERRPNRATPWLTGITYVFLGLLQITIAIGHL